MLRFNNTQKYLTLDFETEDLNLVKTKPFQVSWIVSTLKDGVISEKDYYLKWPDLNMSPSACAITHFDDANYNKNAVDPKKVLDELDTLVYDPSIIIIGQNIFGFDIYVHNILRQLCGKATDYSYMRRVIDTMILSMAKNASIAYNGDNRLLWQYRVSTITKGKGKNSQLALLKSLDIPFDPDKLHNSLYDVTMTWEIFKKLIWSIEIP